MANTDGQGCHTEGSRVNKKDLKKMFGLTLNRRMRFKTSSLQTK